MQITLTTEAAQIVKNLQTLPHRLTAAIARGMDQGNQLALANIKQNHLTGKGPYPVSEHKLGRVTGLLRGSVYATAAQVIGGGRVQSAIGSPVKYAGIHEFGGRIHHPARQVTVRHKLDARGNLVKQLANSILLMFAKAGAKRARTKTVPGKAYDVDMPERAPIRTGLKESAPKYRETISANIVATWKEGT